MLYNNIVAMADLEVVFFLVWDRTRPVKSVQLTIFEYIQSTLCFNHNYQNIRCSSRAALRIHVYNVYTSNSNYCMSFQVLVIKERVNNLRNMNNVLYYFLFF